MARSPGAELRTSRLASRLYRRLQLRVIIAICAMALLPVAQTSRTRVKNKGPRAVGLVQIAANGKGRIIPISIMFDGKFYDAAAYKATPVPMALLSGTVYEAFKSGMSQGTFTVKGAIPNRGSWVGEGLWAAAGSAPPPRKVEAVHTDEELDRPPVLRHAGEGAAGPAPSPTPTVTPTPALTPSPTPTPTPVASAPPEEDHDRPVLRRGKPEPEAASQPSPTRKKDDLKAPRKTDDAKSNPASGAIRSFAAISDEGGAEARPYAYSMKADEEAALKKKMLALVTDALRARDRELAAEVTAKPTGRAGKLEAKFSNEDLRVFDLSISNEPVLVFTANAQLEGKGIQAAERDYFLTMVARQDLYGDLHKVFASITDPSRLNSIPRLELIDAVDADGDGRGELLFRSYSDAGDAYSIYRVIGDQLYPLYEGAASVR